MHPLLGLFLNRGTLVVLGLLCSLFVIPSGMTAEVTLSDLAINDAVEDELALDVWVPDGNINVTTREGIVILQGRVDNILAKDRAARVAKMIRGVRAVTNQIQVSSAMPYRDEEILSKVREALQEDPAVEAEDVAVRVTHGEVFLSGSADSQAEKRLVEKVAKGVRGVKAVDNQMRVDVPYISERPDSEIRKDIEARLRWDILVDHGQIKVDVSEGNVTLKGSVGSAIEKTQAIVDAWVMGVKAIDASSLEAKKWKRDEMFQQDKYAVKSDEAIFKAIHDAFSYDPRVKPFPVQVQVDSGVVTLRGEVDNLKAKRAATRDVMNTVGVLHVRNRLKVIPQEDMEESEIANKVRDALTRSPHIDPHDVAVINRQGVITLSGVVDSPAHRAVADDLASRTKGVLMVVNHLTVRDKKPMVYNPYLDDWYVYGYTDYEERKTLKSDDEIKLSIESEIWWSPFLDSDDVKITVENGVATLTGTVSSWIEYQVAAEKAFQGGATSVYNLLACETCVKGPPSKPYPLESWMMR